MEKDELIQMHTLFCQIRSSLEAYGIATPDSFKEYDSLRISPVHVHKGKKDHKKAVFVLGKELANFICSQDSKTLNTMGTEEKREDKNYAKGVSEAQEERARSYKTVPTRRDVYEDILARKTSSETLENKPDEVNREAAQMNIIRNELELELAPTPKPIDPMKISSKGDRDDMILGFLKTHGINGHVKDYTAYASNRIGLSTYDQATESGAILHAASVKFGLGYTLEYIADILGTTAQRIMSRRDELRKEKIIMVP